jgi:hypothetical protein
MVGRRKSIGLALAVLSLATGAADARHYTHRTHHTYGSYGWSGEHEYYTNVSGHSVHRPVQSSSAPSGASARCRDRSWSFSEHRRGTCSHHGGVSRWL